MIDAGGPFSLVLPCRNQADHIEGVVRSFADALAAEVRESEVVVVPNACTDATAEVVRRLAAARPQVQVVESAEGGWGRAVLAGLAAARGSVLCYTNSARTEPAQVIEVLRRFLERTPCIAKVRRERRGAPVREVGSWLYNLEGRLLFRLGARDVNGTPKVLSRDTFDALALRSTGDLIDMELMAKAAARGLPIVEVPVEGWKRHGGKSSTGWKSAWGMYVGAWRMRGEIAEYRRGLTQIRG